MIIGINGFKGAGKDTVYRLIAEQVPGRVERRALADNLKVMAMLALGYEGSREELLRQADLLKRDGFVDSCYDAGKGRHLQGRQYIINFGQNAREQFGEDFWVDQVLPFDPYSRAKVWGAPDITVPTFNLPDICCVTDIRMENEARRVHELGGQVWRVVRPGAESDGQPTEQPLPDSEVDVTIVNDGDLDKLRARVLVALVKTDEGGLYEADYA